MKEYKHFYCCFSVPQMKYLTENNIRYELIALNPNTKKKFWLYYRTYELNRVLERWGFDKN